MPTTTVHLPPKLLRALIEDMDIAVAAIAMVHAFGVATCNVRHFERIEGLRVDDWSAALPESAGR